MKSKVHDWQPVKSDFEGASYDGKYYVENGLLTVHSMCGGPTSTGAGAAAKTTAGIILGEHLLAAKRQREQEIVLRERQLAKAEHDLAGWNRNGAAEQVALCSMLIEQLQIALAELNSQRP